MERITTKKDAHILYEKTEALQFEEAFPLGNGSLGATVYGGATEDRILLNADTLWSGYPRGERFRGDGKASLDRARAMLRDKRYADANDEISKGFSCYASETYLPMGTLTLRYAYEGGKEPTAYRRTLDLRTALHETSFCVGDAAFRRVAFVSHPANALVYRTECTGSVFSVTVSMASDLYARAYTNISATELYLEGECPVTSEQNLCRTDRTTFYSDDPKERGIRFMTALRVLSDGRTSTHGCSIEVKKATYVELRLVTRNSFSGYGKHPFLEGKEYKNACLEALGTVSAEEHDALRRAHVGDHRRYYARVALDLGSSGTGRLPTSERIRRYSLGKEDKALPALLFNYGRYLTIAGSRKGSEAMNLQGIWNEHLFAPWHANYTVNINTEMNYFPTLAVSLPEMYEPLLRLIRELSAAGRRTARELYAADGWVCHHNTDLWRHTQPVAGSALYLFWNAAGAWFCHHLTEYYEYTRDEGFLRETALPVMKEAARFYLSQLSDSEDGYRLVYCSTSPENEFLDGDRRAAVAETTEMTMATVRELFGSLTRYARETGLTDDVTDAVERELPRLRPAVIGRDGRLLEWYGERIERDPHHRHVSHLYGLYPGNEFSPEKTPDVAEACRRSLDVRGDESTGWSLAWKCCLFARLRDGEHAMSLVRRLLRLATSSGFNYSGGGGVYPNLLCAHPPFQIDANFGITAGIAEMLLQSTGDTVHVAPALPSEWNTVSVRGLSAKGNRKVSFIRKNGALTSCEIKGTMPTRILADGVDITDRFIYRNGTAIYRI